jgi:hypothetical protein
LKNGCGFGWAEAPNGNVSRRTAATRANMAFLVECGGAARDDAANARDGLPPE